MHLKDFKEYACNGNYRTHAVPVHIAPQITEDEGQAYVHAFEANGCANCPAFGGMCVPSVVFTMADSPNGERDEDGRTKQIIVKTSVQPVYNQKYRIKKALD